MPQVSESQKRSKCLVFRIYWSCEPGKCYCISVYLKLQKQIVFHVFIHFIHCIDSWSGRYFLKFMCCSSSKSYTNDVIQLLFLLFVFMHQHFYVVEFFFSALSIAACCCTFSFFFMFFLYLGYIWFYAFRVF